MSGTFQKELLKELVRAGTNYCALWEILQKERKLEPDDRAMTFWRVLSTAVFQTVRSGAAERLCVLIKSRDSLETISEHIATKIMEDSNELKFWMEEQEDTDGICTGRDAFILSTAVEKGCQVMRARRPEPEEPENSFTGGA
jgi:hypothetical protein